MCLKNTARKTSRGWKTPPSPMRIRVKEAFHFAYSAGTVTAFRSKLKTHFLDSYI